MSTRNSSFRRYSSLWLAILVATAVLLGSPTGSLANDPAAAAVIALENRFFFRLYDQDPLEKRVQRLELLVFGATQSGSNEERIARLKRSIAERDRQAAETLSGKSGAGSKAVPSGQYPVLNTLEWRVLKKTFTQESLDQRLDRLESKLFGLPSQAMSYSDRIERLKRTVGIDIARATPPTAGPSGPMPKARPRGQGGSGDDWKQQPWTYGSPLLPDYMPPGTYRTPLPRGLPPQFSEMFQELDRQMEQLMQMPPGSYPYDPGSGIFIAPPSGGPGKPRDIWPRSPRPPAVAPYNDPNSI